MKRIISLILIIVMLFTLFPISVSATDGCNHTRTRKEYYKTEYITKSTNKHIKLRFYNLVCKSCGEVVDLGYKEKEYCHNFADSICTKCGYERTIEELIWGESVIIFKNASTTVYVQDEETSWEYAPKNIGGTTMVPLTIAVEVLGGEFLSWDSDTNSAEVELDDDTIVYTKKTDEHWVNGRRKTANQEAQIVDGKLYVELRPLTQRTGQELAYKDGYILISDDDISSNNVQQLIDYFYLSAKHQNLQL